MFILEEPNPTKTITQIMIKRIINNISKKEHVSVIEILYDLFDKKESKFKWLDSVMNNQFLSPEQKIEFLYVFSMAQKVRTSLSRFIFLVKYKKARVYNISDLFGDSFDSIKPENMITILENNTKYVFPVKELINIMNTALSHSVHFFGEPIACKNPYTNIPFKKSSLYNIYFAIRNSTFIMPILLHQYFLSNFNLTRYAEENEWLIRSYCIDSYSSHISSDSIRLLVSGMFDDCNLSRCPIDRDFPKDKLIEIMRPYIKLYYKGKYSLQNSKCNEYMYRLKVKLRMFIEHNPIFGRKKIIYKMGTFSKKKIVDKVLFNDDHIDFHKKKSTDLFLKSHLTNNPETILNYGEDEDTDVQDSDDATIIDDSDDDSDDDSVD